jgi:inner membrane protein
VKRSWIEGCLMSLLGHVAIGVATARGVAPADQPTKNLAARMFAFSTLALLPDVDFLLDDLAPTVPFLEHRGATHSFAFAVIVGLCVAVGIRALGRRRAAVWGLIAGAVVVSHGLLDYFGDSDLGVALLWPFTDARFLAPWHFLPNPSSTSLSMGLLVDLAVEFALFLPLWLYAFLPRRSRVAEP